MTGKGIKIRSLQRNKEPSYEMKKICAEKNIIQISKFE